MLSERSNHHQIFPALSGCNSGNHSGHHPGNHSGHHTWIHSGNNSGNDNRNHSWSHIMKCLRQCARKQLVIAVNFCYTGPVQADLVSFSSHRLTFWFFQFTLISSIHTPFPVHSMFFHSPSKHTIKKAFESPRSSRVYVYMHSGCIYLSYQDIDIDILYIFLILLKTANLMKIGLMPYIL